MPFVSNKHQTWGGRQVLPGDHLPEVEGWSRARQEHYVRTGVIRKVATLAVAQAPEPTPPAPVVVEPRSPAPAPHEAPGVVGQHAHKGKPSKKR